MREVLYRAWRTFIQAAFGYVSANMLYIVSTSGNDYNLLKAGFECLLISAIAAGLEALMNLPKKGE